MTPDHPTFAVRVGAPGESGHYFDHVFNDRGEAIAYADALARLGPEHIRELSALPRRWASGEPGNPVAEVRVDEVPPNTMVLRSGVAPQPEGAAPQPERVRPGGGPQIQIPYGQLGARPEAVYTTPVVALPSTGHGAATGVAMEEARRSRDEEDPEQR